MTNEELKAACKGILSAHCAAGKTKWYMCADYTTINFAPVIARALLERLEQEERKQRDLEAEYCSTHYQSQPCGTCYWEKKAGDE
jgi:hypothetical protein